MYASDHVHNVLQVAALLSVMVLFCQVSYLSRNLAVFHELLNVIRLGVFEILPSKYMRICINEK
jgi:hypothetical protein